MYVKLEFGNQMQGVHKASLPGPSGEFSNIYRVAKVERCVDCLVKKVIELQLCPMNFSRDGRYMLSRTRQLLLQQVWNTSIEN